MNNMKNNIQVFLSVVSVLLTVIMLLYGSGIISNRAQTVIVVGKEDVYSQKPERIHGDSDDDAVTEDETKNKADDLRIIITNVEQVQHFDYNYFDQYCGDNYEVHFGEGFEGYFEYSRELSPDEYRNWQHGGRLINSKGEEVVINGYHPTFWSNPEGKFAVEYPKGIANGIYTYELYQLIGDKYASARCKIMVDL